MADLARMLGKIWLSILNLFVIIFDLIIIVTEGLRGALACVQPVQSVGLGHIDLGPARNRPSCSGKNGQENKIV